MAISLQTAPERTEDFSLFLGGPVYQFLLRVGLIKPPLDRLIGRLVVIVMVAWAPLLVLTLLGGRCLGGVKIPFLHDFEVQVRLLASLPLLIAAEVMIHNRMTVMLRQFRERQIVTPDFDSRLDLNLVPTRPDRSCGLGFLDAIVFAMSPFLLAHSSPRPSCGRDSRGCSGLDGLPASTSAGRCPYQHSPRRSF